MNGIWIKERGLKANYIIRASHLEKENLMGVTIYEFDKDNNFTRRIEADSANITSLKWVLKNITVINSDGIMLTEPIKLILFILVCTTLKKSKVYIPILIPSHSGILNMKLIY